MSKILAIDFGLKRTGLAITDETNTFAFGLDTIPSEELMHYIKKMVREEQVSVVIVGLPKRLNESDTNITQNIYLLKESIEKEIAEIQVELIDERFTSTMASHAMHTAGASKKQKMQKGLIDKVSATLILQSYLTQQRRV